MLFRSDHTELMGQTYGPKDLELWDRIQPYFDRVKETGIGGDFFLSVPLMVEHHGRRQE